MWRWPQAPSVATRPYRDLLRSLQRRLVQMVPSLLSNCRINVGSRRRQSVVEADVAAQLNASRSADQAIERWIGV
jgi:hypothetical protein